MELKITQIRKKPDVITTTIKITMLSPANSFFNVHNYKLENVINKLITTFVQKTHYFIRNFHCEVRCYLANLLLLLIWLSMVVSWGNQTWRISVYVLKPFLSNNHQDCCAVCCQADQASCCWSLLTSPSLDHQNNTFRTADLSYQ